MKINLKKKKKATTFYDNVIQNQNSLSDSIKLITDLQMYKKQNNGHLKSNIGKNNHFVLKVIILND